MGLYHVNKARQFNQDGLNTKAKITDISSATSGMMK